MRAEAEETTDHRTWSNVSVGGGWRNYEHTEWWNNGQLSQQCAVINPRRRKFTASCSQFYYWQNKQKNCPGIIWCSFPNKIRRGENIHVIPGIWFGRLVGRKCGALAYSTTPGVGAVGHQTAWTDRHALQIFAAYELEMVPEILYYLWQLGFGFTCSYWDTIHSVHISFMVLTETLLWNHCSTFQFVVTRSGSTFHWPTTCKQYLRWW